MLYGFVTGQPLLRTVEKFVLVYQYISVNLVIFFWHFVRVIFSSLLFWKVMGSFLFATSFESWRCPPVGLVR